MVVSSSFQSVSHHIYFLTPPPFLLTCSLFNPPNANWQSSCEQAQSSVHTLVVRAWLLVISCCGQWVVDWLNKPDRPWWKSAYQGSRHTNYTKIKDIRRESMSQYDNDTASTEPKTHIISVEIQCCQGKLTSTLVYRYQLISGGWAGLE